MEEIVSLVSNRVSDCLRLRNVLPDGAGEKNPQGGSGQVGGGNQQQH